MKYEHEYKTTKSKEEFVEAAMDKYINVRKTTVLRRYFEMRKEFGPQDQEFTVAVKYLDNEKSKPSLWKMMEFKDMKRIMKKVNKKMLLSHGFKSTEINWLEDGGYI